MKRMKALTLAFVMLLSFAACDTAQVEEEIPTTSDTTSTTPTTTGATENLSNVRLGNIENRNQFIYDTDDVGNYYFALNFPEGADYLIKDNGFAVLNNEPQREYFSMYEMNRYNYVPSFITTDSALHTFHLLYEFVLKDVERKKLRLSLKSLSENMVEASYQQYQQLIGTDFENAALRNIAFFSVGAKLLDPSFKVRSEVVSLVEEELALINAASLMTVSPIINYGQKYANFTEYCEMDYTQFIPRGHYTQSSELEEYFKASMWYGQATFRSAYADEVRSALLMTSALNSDNARYKDWYQIFDTINFFVGECDDITPVDYVTALSDVYGRNIENLSDVIDEKNFEKAFAKIQELPPPAINTIPIYNEELQPDRDKAITGLRFLGQRFTIDASILQRLMERETKGRKLPTSLDIPAAFGSDEAYEILQSDYGVNDYPNYAENLSGVKQYLGELDEEVWTSNLYWSWINTLRPLTDNNDNAANLPAFMQNKAWLRKELNTFLGSWTELKHDTILYAKLPMAEKGGGAPEPPPPPDDRGYVEPNPEVFMRLSNLCTETIDLLSERKLITYEAEECLGKLATLSKQLSEIATKQLNDAPRTDEEYELIRTYGATLEHIWNVSKKDEMIAADAEYNRDLFLYHHPDAIVADVATDPDSGVALEEATGFANAIVVAFPRDGKLVFGVGLVYSQYEFTVPINERMTDDEWHQRLNNNDVPPLASWKEAFTYQEQ